MKNILIDTNAYVSLRKGRSDAIEIMQHAPIIGMSSVVLGELLSGFILGNRTEKNRHELRIFLDSPRVKILPVDKNTSEYFAQIFYMLRKKGEPIPTNDIWIATTAKQYNLAIYSYDRHFNKIDDLCCGQILSDFL